MATTYAELAANVRNSIATLAQERQEVASTILTVRNACEEGETRNPTDEEAEQVRAAVERREAIDGQMDDLRSRLTELEREAQMESVIATEARAGSQRFDAGHVTGEPSVYNVQSAREGVSFFHDMYAGSFGGDQRSTERFNRYRAELESRAGTTTSFAGLVPPQYLVDQYAVVARAGRPIANTVQRLPLPADGTSFVIPRGTTGATEAVQATENSAVSNTDEVWTNLTIPLATVAGQQVVSRQTLERGTPGIDQIIYNDLAGAYGVAVDQQVISGSGSSGQVLGILNTSGIGAATAFGAAATPATLLTKLAGAINSVETNRFMAPNVIYMHPRRWNWLTSQVDSSNRPLVVPNANGPMNALASFTEPIDTPSAVPVGTILGLPVITDASLPTTAGSASEDQIIVARRDDLLLWEDNDGAPADLRFEQTYGNNLSVLLVAYGYIAFTAGRYPSSVAYIGGQSASGSGLIAPTF